MHAALSLQRNTNSLLTPQDTRRITPSLCSLSARVGSLIWLATTSCARTAVTSSVRHGAQVLRRLSQFLWRLRVRDRSTRTLAQVVKAAALPVHPAALDRQEYASSGAGSSPACIQQRWIISSVHSAALERRWSTAGTVLGPGRPSASAPGRRRSVNVRMRLAPLSARHSSYKSFRCTLGIPSSHHAQSAHSTAGRAFEGWSPRRRTPLGMLLAKAAGCLHVVEVPLWMTARPFLHAA